MTPQVVEPAGPAGGCLYSSSRNRLPAGWRASATAKEVPMRIKNFDPGHWVSISTAASLADVHREWMRRLAKAGKVRAFEMDGQWFVFRQDAESFVRGKRGRPRAGETR
jgi:hypothetical protein